jgi:hypothetical protein
MTTLRCYIAGPMSGLPDYNFPAFHNKAAELRALGYDIVNPAELNAGNNGSWKDCMRVDIRELVTCDAIVPLPGWENSKGAKLEMHIAESLGLQVIRA